MKISVQFSHSVMSDSLQHHGLQYTKLLCLSPTPGWSDDMNLHKYVLYEDMNLYN